MATPQKNASSHFENMYTEDNTPKKILDNVEIQPCHVLRERNRHSDIFNREEEEEGKPVPVIRSNDAANDSARVQYKARQETSNVFAQEQNNPPPAQAEKPHKISNVCF